LTSPQSKRKPAPQVLFTAINEEIQSEKQPEEQQRFKSPPRPVPRNLPRQQSSQSASRSQWIHQKFSQEPQQPKLLKWCRYEWFYSSGDELFFGNNEFKEIYNNLYPNQTTSRSRKDWTEIRKKIGTPKRLSKAFLKREVTKLHTFRQNSVRLRLGIPISPAVNSAEVVKMFSPFPSSGSTVLVIHPVTKELGLGVVKNESPDYEVSIDSQVFHVPDEDILVWFCLVSYLKH